MHQDSAHVSMSTTDPRVALLEKQHILDNSSPRAILGNLRRAGGRRVNPTASLPPSSR